MYDYIIFPKVLMCYNCFNQCDFPSVGLSRFLTVCKQKMLRAGSPITQPKEDCDWLAAWEGALSLKHNTYSHLGLLSLC